MVSKKEEKKHLTEENGGEDVNEKIEEMTIQSDGEDEGDLQMKSKEESRENDAMERVNAYYEDMQGDEQNDDKMKTALSALREQEQASKDAERKREKELAAVQIKKEDVTLVVEEFELSPSVAERKLREANGNVTECLKKLLEE